MITRQIFTITASDDGKRLDRLARQLMPTLPYEWVQKAFRTKDIRLNGKKADPSVKVSEGNTIEIRYPKQLHKPSDMPISPSQRTRWRKELQEMILYEDEETYVFNKPSGLAVQGGSDIKKSLDAMLEALTHPKKGRPKLVHRLDRETSGVILVARTAAMARKLTQDFKEKRIEKTYHAWVVGKPKKKQGTIRLALKKQRRGGVERVEGADDGQEAITHYRVLSSQNGASLLELKPETGRMHQLRVHRQALGCPIIGDRKYAGNTPHPKGFPDHLHLHASKIRFQDSDGCDVVVYGSNLPDSWVFQGNKTLPVLDKAHDQLKSGQKSLLNLDDWDV